MSLSEKERCASRTSEQKSTSTPAGAIPVIAVRGRTLPEAWEKALLETWKRGAPVRTQYDGEGDPPSRDATVIIEVEQPLGEPRIHRSFPAGLEELEIYRQEVVFGVHDSWIDPVQGKWSYTYHQRLFAYDVIRSFDDARRGGPFGLVDQIEVMVRDLADCPHTRRAQAITWMPTVDAGHSDPPCLQRLWARLLPDADGTPLLNLNTHWRSRDGYKAAFMNMYALTELQQHLAERVAERLGRPVRVGRHVDISDSFHIYGAYFREFEEHFLKLCRERPFSERVWTTEDVEASLVSGRVALLNGKPGEPPLSDEHRRRLYAEVPEEYRSMLRDGVRAELEALASKRGRAS